MDNIINENIEEINLLEIDWNKLSISEFHALEQKLQQKEKQTRLANPKDRITGYVNVKIRERTYVLKAGVWERLKKMKSERAKEKLIDEIVLSHNPLNEL